MVSIPFSLYGHGQAQEPLHLVHNYYLFSMSNLFHRVQSTEVGKMIGKHFHYMIYMTMPYMKHKNLYPGGHEIYNLQFL